MSSAVVQFLKIRIMSIVNDISNAYIVYYVQFLAFHVY